MTRKKWFLICGAAAAAALVLTCFLLGRDGRHYVGPADRLCVQLLTPNESTGATVESMLSTDVRMGIGSGEVIIFAQPGSTLAEMVFDIQVDGDRLAPIRVARTDENPQFIAAGKDWFVRFITHDRMEELNAL